MKGGVGISQSHERHPERLSRSLQRRFFNNPGRDPSTTGNNRGVKPFTLPLMSCIRIRTPGRETEGAKQLGPVCLAECMRSGAMLGTGAFDRIYC